MIPELLLTAATALIAYSFYKWATLNNDYFKRRGIKYSKPIFLIGNGGVLTKRLTAAELGQIIYNKFSNESVYGMFLSRTPILIVRDPKVIKTLTVRDFDSFENHKSFTNDKLWGKSLALLRDKKWRDMRAALSPAFTGSKMRQMFDLVCDCAEEYVNYFMRQAESANKVNVEMDDIFHRYTADVTVSCAFGVKINSLEHPENEFFLAGEKMIDFGRVTMFARFLVINKLPKLAKLLNIQLHGAKVTNLFISVILDMMNMRKTYNIHRPDLINTLIKLRDGSTKQQPDEKSNEANDGFATVQESEIGKKSVNRIWSDDEIVAQGFIFFFTSFETLSMALACAPYELIANKEIQRKLYDEIAETNERIGGKRITYDALQKMKYMDQVVCELLRKHTPVIFTNRQCSKDYAYDDGEDLKFTLGKGIEVVIPIFGLHHDPKHFPDPDRFDPERFSEENKHKIIPGSYLPFGIGPRGCIGSRFGLMLLKTILYYLLLNFSFERNERTEIPLRFAKNPFIIRTENGVHIELKPRKIKAI